MRAVPVAAPALRSLMMRNGRWSANATFRGRSSEPMPNPSNLPSGRLGQLCQLCQLDQSCGGFQLQPAGASVCVHAQDAEGLANDHMFDPVADGQTGKLAGH